jgi:hypothetical protein
MKIKLDQNLPVRLSTFVKELGHDVDTVHDEQPIGHPDSEIWERLRKSRGF